MSSDARPFGELFAEPTRNGLNRPKAVRGAGVKMVNMGELFAHSRLCNTPMERVPLSESEADRFLLEEGDLLFARQSLVLEGAGKCSVFLSDDEPVTFESHVTRVRLDQEIAHPDYYYYYFQSHDGRSAIRSIVEQGAGASGIRGRDLATLDVYWRPLPEQRAIAHVLGTLDDKIELNRRMNETLEEMARALFKSLFVDFDPVRAKAALKRHSLHAYDPDTGTASDPQDGEWTVERARAYLDAMDPQIVDLFPDRLVDSELGEIPEGWKVHSLDGIADFTNGLALQRYPPEGDDWLPVIKIAEMRRGYTDKTGRASADLASRFIVEDGDLLFSWSGSLELVFWTHGRGALNQHLFKVTSDEFPKWLYWGWTTEHLDGFRQIAAAKATTMGHIQRHHLTDAKVAAPLPDVIASGNRLIGDLADQRITHAIQSRLLAAHRDALLSGLVSGRILVHTLKDG